MKYVYFFGNGDADGSRDDRELLGGKGADLAEMARLGIRVPPGFTVSTEACLHYLEDGRLPGDVRDEIREGLSRLEGLRDRRLGDATAPLLLSVRSGAVVSMPGMMDTVLDLGCNRDVVDGLAELSGDRRFALDTYRRLIQMYTNVVQGLKLEEFEEVLDRAVEDEGVESDVDLPAGRLDGIVDRFLEIYREEVGGDFPTDPVEQVEAAVAAVFGSWNTSRARKYRELHGIAGDLGTAANVQSMVFGNLNDRSGSGVAFTRNPATGDRKLYGEWLPKAQGEDVVAGVRTPRPISSAQQGIPGAGADGESGAGAGGEHGGVEALEDRMPEVHEELETVARRLEEHYADMLDLEFTIEDGELFMLQTRRGKRTGVAGVRIAVDLVDEGLVEPEGALERVDAAALEQLLHPRVEESWDGEPVARGLPASPGAATGAVVFDADEAERRGEAGEEVILLRPMTVADDVGAMAAAQGVLTARGGMTSHAAVVARGMGIPCVTGAGDLHIDLDAGVVSVGDRKIRAGDVITVDGTRGLVFLGEAPLVEPEMGDAAARLMEWADAARDLEVRANADNGPDAARARRFGAAGIGLCRTEHMFFAHERLPLVRRMILATDEEQRGDALAGLESFQHDDFVELFEAMDGLPVTIRLLDPPLHEFLPEEPGEVEALAGDLGRDPEVLGRRIRELRGENPMLGHRGCRVGITSPAIYRMQTRAILRAAATVRDGGGTPHPEIMVPLVAASAELRWLRLHVLEPVVEALEEEEGETVGHRFGAMIETPRACLDAGEIAREASFLSFGTNDLTQMTYGFSRDDSGEFLPTYQEHELFAGDPFQHIDRHGVGELVRIAVRRAREQDPDVVLGVCGEHGGDPRSIAFWHEVGLDYVSCSPYRVPTARVAVAQAAAGDGSR